PEDEHGRGLQLGASTSRRWGTRPRGDDVGKTVWFELAVPRCPPRDAVSHGGAKSAKEGTRGVRRLARRVYAPPSAVERPVRVRDRCRRGGFDDVSAG